MEVLTSIAPDFVMGTDDQPDGDMRYLFTETGYYMAQAADTMETNLRGHFLIYTEYGLQCLF